MKLCFHFSIRLHDVGSHRGNFVFLSHANKRRQLASLSALDRLIYRTLQIASQNLSQLRRYSSFLFHDLELEAKGEYQDFVES
jgi:hypothetical protein